MQCPLCKLTAWIWSSSADAQTGTCHGKDLPLLSTQAAPDESKQGNNSLRAPALVRPEHGSARLRV